MASNASPDVLFDLSDKLLLWGSEYGIRVLIALVILLIGNLIAKRVRSVFTKVLEKRGIDQTLIPFVASLIYYILMAVIIVAALGQVGINITSFLAILGAAGLAIGLALKESLSNFASGVMLLIHRYYRVGDYVNVAGTSGTVSSLNIFNTELLTPDNQKIYVPNANILGNQIVNVTANDTRRLDLTVGISYRDDIDQAKSILQEILHAETRLLSDPPPTIAVAELGESSVNLVVRPWVKTDEYWAVRFDLIEKIKKTLDERGITIPFPQRDVHLHQLEG
jgi:small conductance mechanosensitive channel